jgi:hypothetical protein
MKLYVGRKGAVRSVGFAVAACLVLAGCAADEDPSGDSTNGAVSSTPSLSPTDEPEWRDEYTETQLAAYEEALDRWMTYEQRSESIYSRGLATPAAEELFKEYFSSPLWQDKFEELQTFEQVEVTIEGVPEVYWSKALEVTAGAKSVMIQQCVDYTTVITTQWGKEIARSKPKPQLRTLYLSRPQGYDWLIYGVTELVKGKARPCTP